MWVLSKICKTEWTSAMREPPPPGDSQTLALAHESAQFMDSMGKRTRIYQEASPPSKLAPRTGRSHQGHSQTPGPTGTWAGKQEPTHPLPCHKQTADPEKHSLQWQLLR